MQRDAQLVQAIYSQVNVEHVFLDIMELIKNVPPALQLQIVLLAQAQLLVLHVPQDLLSLQLLVEQLLKIHAFLAQISYQAVIHVNWMMLERLLNALHVIQEQ